MICVLVGPPGSGKGTQAELLAGALSVPHVSTGDLLRAETVEGTPLGRQVASTLAAGELVPDEVIGQMLERRLRDPDAVGGVLLDGYPRTVPQARTLDALLEAAGRRVDAVLALGVDDETLVGRLQRRALEQHRTDDNPESIAERLREYRQLTEPVIDYYRGRGTPVLEVDGTGEVGEIHRRVRDALGSVANPPAW